jgi:predicted nucleic acid-binding protein
MIREVPFASLLLDSGAVLALAQNDRRAQGWLDRARTEGVEPRVALVTVAEVFRDRRDGARIQWVLSRLRPEPLTLAHAHDAGRLLSVPGSAGHTVDAIIAATAVRMPKPVIVLTSDPKDLERLLEGQRRITVATV